MEGAPEYESSEEVRYSVSRALLMCLQTSFVVDEVSMIIKEVRIACFPALPRGVAHVFAGSVWSRPSA